MRMGSGAVALLAVAVLAACSSNSNGSGNLKPTLPTEAVTTQATGTAAPGGGGSSSKGGNGAAGAFCAKLATGQQQLSEFGSAASDPTKLKSLFDTEIAYFKDLLGAAPAEVAAAIDDMIVTMQAAEQAMADPSSGNAAALGDLATKLPADAQKLTAYITANCTGS